MCGGVRGVWRECGGGGVMFGFLEVGKISFIWWRPVCSIRLFCISREMW